MVMCTKCSREVYEGSQECIFHLPMEYTSILPIGLINGAFFENESRFERITKSKNEKKTISDFISKFREFTSQILENQSSQNSELDIQGFIFPELNPQEWKDLWRDIKKCDFDGNNFRAHNLAIVADHAEFNCEVDFSNSKFYGKTSFRSVIFKRFTTFSLACFYPEEKAQDGNSVNSSSSSADFVNFSFAQFHSNIIFSSTEFLSSVFFMSAIFKGAFISNNTRYYGEVSFSGADFGGPCLFTDCRFGERIFPYTRNDLRSEDIRDNPVKDVSFQGAKFNSLFKIDRSTFNCIVDFGQASFHGDFELLRSTLLSCVFFNHATFYKKSKIFQTKFLGSLYRFDEIQVKGDLTLEECYFRSEAIITFRKTDISGTLRLLTAWREGVSDNEIEAAKRKNNDAIAKLYATPYLNFQELMFYDDGQMVLEAINLDKSTFWKSNMFLVRPRMDFIRVSWPVRREKKGANGSSLRNRLKKFLLGSRERRITCDDTFQKSLKEDQKDHSELERQYNQIRSAYEQKGAYSEAGDFFIGEMEARSKRLKKDDSIFYRALHRLYGFFALWGESPGRTISTFFALAFILAVPALFMGFKFESKPLCEATQNQYCLDNVYYMEYNVLPSPENVYQFEIGNYFSDYFTALSFILQSMTFFNINDYKPLSSPWGEIFLVFVHIFGVSLIAIFGISLRRKFRRVSGE